MMDHLQASKGIWIPKMVHRRDPKLSGTWGRWNEVNDVYYGFDEVKGFWFAGQKQDPNEREWMSSIYSSFLPELGYHTSNSLMC